MDALAKKVMSKHGLSLEAARKHRAKQMPQRVVDPTSRLGSVSYTHLTLPTKA